MTANRGFLVHTPTDDRPLSFLPSPPRYPIYMPYMTATDKLFGTTVLTGDRAETIKKTYLLLGLSVAGAYCGGYLGAQSDVLAGLFTGWIGWILAMLLLNLIPRVAIAARHNPVLGVTALLADGFVSDRK